MEEQTETLTIRTVACFLFFLLHSQKMLHPSTSTILTSLTGEERK